MQRYIKYDKLLLMGYEGSDQWGEDETKSKGLKTWLAEFLGSLGRRRQNESELGDFEEAGLAYKEEVAEAEGNFGGQMDNILDGVTRNKAAQIAILTALEFVGFAGYGVGDVLTGIDGVRDLGSAATRDEGAERDRLRLRGALKLVAAFTPGVPSGWVAPVLNKYMPTGQIQNDD